MNSRNESVHDTRFISLDPILHDDLFYKPMFFFFFLRKVNGLQDRVVNPKGNYGEKGFHWGDWNQLFGFKSNYK